MEWVKGRGEGRGAREAGTAAGRHIQGPTGHQVAKVDKAEKLEEVQLAGQEGAARPPTTLKGQHPILSLNGLGLYLDYPGPQFPNYRVV